MSGTRGPSTTEVANTLGVDGRRLRQFAEIHPNATPAIILGWAGADPEHEDLVAEWLAWVRDDQWQAAKKPSAMGERA